MKKYPYQNLGLKNIKGERWKGIPGLELYFKVSNLGRVKRMEYEQEYSDGRIYLRAAQIIKPVVMRIPNSFMNDAITFLRTAITLNKQKYNYSLARLVYHCFKEPFDVGDENILILTKDSDGLNIRPSNLKKATKSEKQKRIYELNRKEPFVFDENAKRKGIAKSKLIHNRQVTQYTMQGGKIKTYPSVATASKKTGVSPGHISSRARGTEYSAGGYIWRYGNAERIDIRPMLDSIEQRWERNKENFGKKVTQYKMNGERVAHFPTINDASKVTGVETADVSAVMNKKRNSAGGFYWQKGYGPALIDLSKHEYGETLRAKRKQKPVKQYSKSGIYLKTFNSVKEAAQAIGISSATLSGTLGGKQKYSGGYKWKYVKG